MTTSSNFGTQQHQQREALQIDWMKIAAVLLWMMLAGVFVWYQSKHDLSFNEMTQLLATQLASPWGVLILVVANLIRPLIFFSAPVLVMLTGAIFGPVWGVILSVVFMNLGAMLAYGVGRLLSNSMSQAFTQNSLSQKYSERMRQSSFQTVLIMRLLFLPYDVVNYAAGFLQVSPKSFLLATAIGSFPGIISFTILGGSVDWTQGLSEVELNSWALAASIMILVVSLGVSRIIQMKFVDPNAE